MRKFNKFSVFIIITILTENSSLNRLMKLTFQHYIEICAKLQKWYFMIKKLCLEIFNTNSCITKYFQLQFLKFVKYRKFEKFKKTS